MADLQPLSDAEREELVAYLDGELDQRAARAVEAKLNRDPRIRAEAEALRRSWHLLDFLPKPEPSATFTNRTMTRVSTLRPLTQVKSGFRWRPWAFSLGWAAALVAAGWIGYASVPVPAPAPVNLPPATQPATEVDPELVRDLAVIEHLHQYENAGDIHFVNELDRPELFGGERPED
jgi:anti-sigma factor RsiW